VISNFLLQVAFCIPVELTYTTDLPNGKKKLRQKISRSSEDSIRYLKQIYFAIFKQQV